ncbi:RNA/RNP complex-1-interacting phosphatase isoform X1 [Bactrocera oleae]|uniref:RNA/RNP complex-1-interacting phosphatase isoform X1 n=1 Tax=Bactrocera oleae TaxID=104688 RepID=UPI00387E21E4
MARSIPDRWLNYTPMGQRVEGTRFIAFKVPLREAVNENVEEQRRLDVTILLKSIPNLGMIIDLTNTSRYYTPDCFVNKGLEYNKLMIPGHHIPPPYLVHRFKKLVFDFLNKNAGNDKLIGVHCTHGVNRTGYLICNYMISELDVKPEDAIDKFNHSRGHKIERKNYLDSLYDLTKAAQNANSTESNYNALKPDTKSLIEASSKKPISTQELKLPPSPNDLDRRARFERALSWPATQELKLAPSPKHFDRRDRFERIRQDANMQQQRITSAANAAAASPARQLLDNSFANSQRNERNYSSRYVNTSRHLNQGGASYPYPNRQHHDTIRANYNQYVDYAQNNYRYEDSTYQRRYELNKRLPQSSKHRNHPYRRI